MSFAVCSTPIMYAPSSMHLFSRKSQTTETNHLCSKIFTPLAPSYLWNGLQQCLAEEANPRRRQQLASLRRRLAQVLRTAGLLLLGQLQQQHLRRLQHQHPQQHPQQHPRLLQQQLQQLNMHRHPHRRRLQRHRLQHLQAEA